MAPRLSGFTRASSLGPISEFMDRHGGSFTRALRNVDLPFAILEQPDIVIPLREQFRLLEKAARETGDPYFGARLGQAVKGRELSSFGAWVCSADKLDGAIRRAHAGLNTMLQTSTVLTFTRRGSKVRWSIEFVEPETEGRHHNEFLGVSYMIDMIRGYAGRTWRPDVVMSVLPAGSPRQALEEIFGTNVLHGCGVPAIEFDASLLGRLSCEASASSVDGYLEPRVPRQSDVVATIKSVTELALHEGYPHIKWVASKLGTTGRSLQRWLDMHGTSFNRVVDGVMETQAKDLLRQSEISVTQIALRLGYSDPAHFTRAFRRWTGMTPSAYRSEQR
ncbi:AraC family transcriptional regulator [Hyphomicrobium sp.]|uniref:AraC family transcriptional regulator n=1 Tax=Hyphomicrobium sp. TaxID=82 RepID=UPI002C8A6809|nr:AraC family transcriptional regulator ligand-binding domain-containing protein [Hyphomicrobium sp.]HVZ03135.1 AraC family transcriptional regulator ligand-binding domain-containing protein [Hyphomicrobium sp.]